MNQSFDELNCENRPVFTHFLENANDVNETNGIKMYRIYL